MSMNIFNISKEIHKINTSLEILKNQIELNNNANINLNTITNDIKNNMNDMNSKIEQLYDFNVNSKIKYDNINYNEIKDFLISINIESDIINKVLFMNFNSFNELILTDDDIFENLDIPKNIITYIKNKIQDKIYISNIDI
jgi:hypothetical protein